MKILSLDIGIKNLAFCLFEKTSEDSYFKIKSWDVVNLTEENEIPLCQFIEKNVQCTKPAKYKTDKECFCVKHSKKQNFHIPTSELKTSFVNKQKIQTLIELANKYGIPYEKPTKKNDLVYIINEYIEKTCFTPIVSKKSSKVDLVTIGKNIKTKFNKAFLEETTIDYVLIENQISPIANRMKTIQGMIAQYFIMNDTANHIEFVSASNKLKDCFVKEKTTYTMRKKMSIQKCLEIMETNCHFTDKSKFFVSHQKKDDLADCFLQGLWFIKEKKEFML